MKNNLNFNRMLTYLKRHPKKNLVATGAIVLAGIAVGSIGILGLQYALHEWISSGALWGEPFDTMIAKTIASIAYILPSVLFFVVAYLIAESHSLGLKLSLALSIVSLAIGIGITNVALTLAGVLCFLGTEIEFLTRKRTIGKKLDSPVITEKVAKFGLRISGLIGVLILIGIIAYISIRGISYISWNFVTGAGYAPVYLRFLIEGTQQMGIVEYITGSFLIVGLCEAIAFPLGLGSAIYMAEYAPKNHITSTIRFFIETLAGAPSIIIALFGVYFLAQKGIGLGWGVSWLTASVCLAFMTLPWNIRVAEEAMKAVPYSYREGAYALGATKWQAIRKVVLMSATPGAITGFILGLGAAFGETTVLILTADSGNTRLPAGLPLAGEGTGMPSLPVMIFRTYFWNIGSGQAGIDYQWEKTNVAFAAGFVLLAIFLAICFAALLLRNYVSKKNAGT